MSIPTPFHPRTSRLCTSLLYKDWAGYYAVRSYDTEHDREYFAFRHAAGMIDVTPLYKHEVYGPDAGAFLARVMVRNIAKLKLHRVAYMCWCDDNGRVIDDGTVSRIDEDYYRVTSTEPALHWLLRHARGYDVTIEDSSTKIAVVAVQGPNSRDIVSAATSGDAQSLKFFRLVQTRIDGFEALVSRTGYTGDLGYEIWVKNDDAGRLWDAMIAAGKPYGLEPAGLDAMDVTRIEAGFILNGVDYFSSLHAMIDRRKSTPYELALGWAVHLKHKPFIGRDVLAREKKEGPRRLLVGLDIDWDEHEALFRGHGLPPEIHPGGWRDGVPVYSMDGQFIGQATSGTWSPLLKKNIAMATVEAPHGKTGNKIRFEVTVEYERRTVTATVVDKPFFAPPRMRE